jgi:hypothetical protein
MRRNLNKTSQLTGNSNIKDISRSETQKYIVERNIQEFEAVKTPLIILAMEDNQITYPAILTGNDSDITENVENLEKMKEKY